MKCERLLDIVNQIDNEKIRTFTISVLNSLSDEFYTMPTSTSGKYHPPECNAPGGLIVHIQRACYFANLFINSNRWDRNDIRGDIVISACLLHDIGKKEKYENFAEYNNHPIIGVKIAEKFKHIIPESHWRLISNCILYHMNVYGPKSLKKEKYNILELMVYQSDFLASKKEIVIHV